MIILSFKKLRCDLQKLTSVQFFLAEPKKEWTLENGAFAPPIDLKVKLQARV